MKRPAFQFYPADWRKDVELGACGYIARGIWFEMLCIMHEAQPYGHMVRDGRAIPDQAAANLVRAPLKAYRQAVQELEENGVISRTADGIIYSRRMVKDENLRSTRADCGKLGAEHGIKGKEYGVQGGRPSVDKSVDKLRLNGANNPPSTETGTGQKPPPSFAVAFASSSASSKPALERIPDIPVQANGSHGRPDRPKENGKTESWSSMTWVSATAKTIGMDRRNGERDDDFADRVHTEVEARRRRAATEAKRHA